MDILFLLINNVNDDYSDKNYDKSGYISDNDDYNRYLVLILWCGYWFFEKNLFVDLYMW